MQCCTSCCNRFKETKARKTKGRKDLTPSGIRTNNLLRNALKRTTPTAQSGRGREGPRSNPETANFFSRVSPVFISQQTLKKIQIEK